MMKKKKTKKRKHKLWWENIKFKYKLSIINENSLEEVIGLRISKLNGLSVLISVLLVLFLIAAVIIAYTPLRNYLPGYMNSKVRSQIVRNALRTDSLQELLAQQNLYIMNIQDIFRGNVRPDTVVSIDSLTTLRADTLMERTKREEEFRRQYEETEKYNLTAITERTDAGGMVFYRPAPGMITNHFDADHRHFGIDMAAGNGESIVSTLEGTVILSGYTAESGYTIMVQHSHDFVSVYKYCSSLLKKEGDAVAAGEAIALNMPGSAAHEGSEAHFHFELWHKGRAVNPELYIVF